MSGVDPKLLEILVCPLCKGTLVMRKDELVHAIDPDMPEEEARKLPPQEEVV